MGSLTLVTGDITALSVDAIINAANQSLLGGGGVDGAIHRAAGPDLLAACRTLGGCQPGGAKLTPGYRLPARFVIHTVGPIWRGGSRGEPETLRRCYRSCLKVAKEQGLRTLAFPSISTGAYRYPIEEAARIAVEELRAGLVACPELEATVVCFQPDVRLAYERVLEGSS